jgi:tRNA dimethylallyltransferase
VKFEPARAWFVAGPTAVGKSTVALELAERLGGEILSVDSMQVYRGLDLGTAKPSPADRARVPHHLIDVAEPGDSFDVARFVELAQAASAEMLGRGRVPVFCGGTGLYFKALLEGLGEAPASDPALRRELEATPLAALLQELAERDPATFARIDRHNPRRVVRAVELVRLSGRPAAELRAVWQKPSYRGASPGELTIIGLERDPADLRARIDTRVNAMFAHGLVDEARRLLGQGLAENRTAMQAIGYRQVVEHLRGEWPLDATIELVKVKTRQLARRQMTWFRRQLPMRWLKVAPDEAPTVTAQRVLGLAGR